MLASDHRGFVGVWPLRLSFCAAASRPSFLCGGEAPLPSLQLPPSENTEYWPQRLKQKCIEEGSGLAKVQVKRSNSKSDYSDSLVWFVGCGDLKLKTAQVTMQSVHLQTLRYWHLAGSIHSFLDNPIPIK